MVGKAWRRQQWTVDEMDEAVVGGVGLVFFR